MPEIKLTPDSVKAEVARIKGAGLSKESAQRNIERLKDLQKQAEAIPNGYVKKIVWDKEGGYPEHAWGYTQWTVRPFVQGYGCDGSTDENVHLIAAILCEKVGIDYADCYTRAYSDDGDLASNAKWIAELKAKASVKDETLLPDEVTADALVLMLSDLYQINNRSLVDVLEDELDTKGWNVRDFCSKEDEAKERVRAIFA